MCTSCITKLKITKLQNYRNFCKSEKEWKYLDGVIYGLDYAQNPQIQVAVKQFKYRFTQELSDFFGEIIARKLSELNMNKGRRNILIPVPLHQKRLNYRGFNQAELLADATSKKIDNTSVLKILNRARYTDQQAKLSKEERHSNLKDAFSVLHFNIDDEAVYFIVDDVCTTGATLENCAKVLKESGLKKVYGLVVARAMK